MTTVMAWVRTLGNSGAVANARVLADQRTAQTRTVEAIARRVDATIELRAPNRELGSVLDAASPVNDRSASAA